MSPSTRTKGGFLGPEGDAAFQLALLQVFRHEYLALGEEHHEFSIPAAQAGEHARTGLTGELDPDMPPALPSVGMPWAAKRRPDPQARRGRGGPLRRR